jgi:hypothetical protein
MALLTGDYNPRGGWSFICCCVIPIILTLAISFLVMVIVRLTDPSSLSWAVVLVPIYFVEALVFLVASGFLWEVNYGEYTMTLFKEDDFIIEGPAPAYYKCGLLLRYVMLISIITSTVLLTVWDTLNLIVVIPLIVSYSLIIG